MTRVRFSKMASVYPKGHFIQWVLDDAKDSGSYVFDVYRSGGQDGPWETVATGLADQYAYFDRFEPPANTDPSTYLPPNQFRQFRNFYYRVRVTTPTGQTVEVIDEVGPSIGGAENSLISRKMAQYHRRAVRNFNVGLQRFVGMPVALLKRKTWGTRCAKCTDPRSKEIIRPNCTSCWGTGFIGGYWKPTLTYARRGSENAASTVKVEGKSDSSEVTVWIPDIPCLERDDVIVFLDDNKRFRIDKQSQSEIRLTAVHQTFTCQLIDHSHILYRYPIEASQISPIF